MIVKLFTLFATLLMSLDVLAKIPDNGIDPIGYSVCRIIAISQYNITRLIAIIAIMGLGVLSLRGKLSWIISLMLSVGIIIIYKAPMIAGVIYGDSVAYCTGDDWSGYGNDDVIGSALCKVVKLFRSTTMYAVAVISLIVLGIQSLRGALSWTITLMSVVGIILMFSAPNILVTIHGQNDYDQNCYGRREGVNAK